MTDKDFVEDVYYSVVGELSEEYRVPGVDNVFERGMRCDILYEDMLAAYERLRDRLGVEDADDDVEIIISALMDIGKETAMAMYRCGAKFGYKQE